MRAQIHDQRVSLNFLGVRQLHLRLDCFPFLLAGAALIVGITWLFRNKNHVSLNIEPDNLGGITPNLDVMF
jgi:hypothetical protein